jgi:hypothetical protein
VNLNKRERNIAIGTSAAVLLGLLYWLAWEPYAQSLDALESQKTALIQQDSQNQIAIGFQHRHAIDWSTMRRSGLRNDSSNAESQFYAAMLYWAQHARTSDPSFKTDPPKPDKDAAANGFEIVTFHVTVTGTLSQISDLMWSVETATIPLRVMDLQVTPKKEGLDNGASPLTAQITVATLSMLQAPEPADSQPPVSAAFAGTTASAGGNGI